MKRLLMGGLLLAIMFVNVAAWAGHSTQDLSGRNDPVQDYGDDSAPEREESPMEPAEGVM